MVSIAQATEFGTVYTRDEIAAIGDVARAHDLFLHMDGARFANAIASLNCAPKQITWEVGVDGFIDTTEGYKGEIETEIIKSFRSTRFRNRIVATSNESNI